MRQRVLVVSVAYLSSPLLKAHLTSIKQSSQDVDLRHLVVDNSSEDESRRVVELFNAESNSHVSYLAIAGNPGYGAAANVGWQLARDGEYVLISNPDLVLRPDGALRMMAEAIERSPRVLAATPILTSSEGRRVRMRKGLPTPLTYPKWIATGIGFAGRRMQRAATGVVNISGSAVMFSPEFAERVGRFDEDYFLFMEDTDLSKRILEGGYSVVELADVLSLHAGGASMARVGKAHTALQGFVSRGVYFEKHFGRSGMRLAMLWVLPEAVMYSLLRAIRYRDASQLAHAREFYGLAAAMWTQGAVCVQDTRVRPLFNSRLPVSELTPGRGQV